MAISIRLINFDSDRETIISLLKRNRTLSPSYPYAERYDWMYLDNPHGKATGWLAIDDASGKTVGFTVALPREMSVLGKRVLAWNCADFSIDTQFRTLGIAAKLRRGAKDAVDRGQYMFLYAHPNDRMLVIHKRVGHTPISQMQRYAKLINVEGKIESISNTRTIAKLISPAANQFLDYVDRLRTTKNEYEIEIHQNLKFTDEFTVFYNEMEKSHKVWGVRDAIYLNWRYHDNPIYKSDSLVARKDGKVVGYIIYTFEDHGGALIKDIVALEQDALPTMLLKLSHNLRKRPNCGSISFIASETNPNIANLKKLGFHQRPETSAIVVHSCPDFEFKSSIYDPSKWFMTVGDRDE